ncbi:hypothetical protein BDV26DRAFT_268349 [Aspergillus bertholletiae]|uniref:Amine oxidase n=1 Tax=Aspergillus bertholletiae TaxID=1226010 RepID=A0A5N7AZ75_9EURO|nr:hypothetical protein BDV26DRAFT_268349 [Aspergillus bertholletiae]
MPIPEDDKAATSKAFTKVQQLAKSINLEDPASSPGAKELDQLTLQEYCIRTFESEFVTSLFNRISRSLLGLDSDEISLLSFVYYCKSGTGINALLSSRKNGAQYIRLREGTQTFSTNMAKELSPGSLYLSTPAAEIKQCSTSGQCTVVSSTGRCFTAKKVILSVPSPLYSTIRFDPPLPESKQSLAQSNRLGYYSKIIFVFDTPWWREAGFSGSTQASDGPIEFTVDTSISDDAQWSISCFIVGQRGRKWSQLSETERRRSAWEQLCASFQGAKAVSGKDFSIPEPINVLEYEWIKQDYFRGAPCPVAPPGLLCSIDGSASRAPFGSVHFVGTETSLEWKGYMEGAVRSGDRGAREVITVLKPGAEF